MRAVTRRDLLRRTLAAAALLVPGRPAAAVLRTRARAPHPTPRPGITGERVLTRERLGDASRLAALFDAVRAAPQIVDGIGCACGCAELPGNYSLLSCFEGEAMARHCVICQGQARLATRLHGEGKTLDAIRDALDAKYG